LLLALLIAHGETSFSEILMGFLPSANDLLLFATAAVILLLVPGPAVLFRPGHGDSGQRVEAQMTVMFWAKMMSSPLPGARRS